MPAGVGRPRAARLRVNNDPLAPPFQRLGDQLMIVAVAIACRGVDKINSQIERAVQGCDGFVVVGGSIGARHTHATQTQRRNIKIRRAELPIFHWWFLPTAEMRASS